METVEKLKNIEKELKEIIDSIPALPGADQTFFHLTDSLRIIRTERAKLEGQNKESIHPISLYA